MSNIAEVKKLAAEGDSNKIIRAKLTIAGLSDKEISALIKEAGIGRNTSGFTQTNTLALLETGITEYELYKAILNAGAKNEARWIGDRNRIRMTLNKIFAKFESPVDESPADDSQKEAIKTLLGK